MPEDGGGRKGGGVVVAALSGIWGLRAGLGGGPGAQADARAVVRRANEFDAGGFECS